MGGLVDLMVHILVDGGDHAVALHIELRAGHMGGAPAAVSAVIGFLTADQTDSGHLSVFAQNLHRGSHGDDLHALFPGLLDLLGTGGHLLLRSAVDHRNCARTQADRGSGHVHGRAAASDDHQLIRHGQIAL